MIGGLSSQQITAVQQVMPETHIAVYQLHLRGSMDAFGRCSETYMLVNGLHDGRISSESFVAEMNRELEVATERKEAIRLHNCA